MSDQKISQLSDGGASQATDEYVIARSGANYRIDGASVAAAATSVGTLSSLTVSGTSSLNGAVTINDAGANVDFRVEGDTEQNLLFVDASADCVGIGTASPDSKLVVQGASGTYVQVKDGTVNTFVQARSADSVGVVGTLTNHGLAFWTNSQSRATLDASGNLGLGVTPSAWNTSYKGLEVGALGSGFMSKAGEANLYIVANATYNNTPAWVRPYADVASFYQQTGGVHIWGNAVTGSAGSSITWLERARITSGGNLLVGDTATTAFFDGSTCSYNASYPGVSAKTGGGAEMPGLTSWNNATSGDNRFVEFATETSATSRGNIDYNRAAGLVRYNTSSDATLKNILGDADGSKSIEILSTTRIREYAWKDDETQKPQIGVIAQELYETFKGAVSVGGEVERTDEEGNVTTSYTPWAVDKTAFTFHLVAGWQAHEKALQEAMARIEALEARLEALEA